MIVSITGSRTFSDFEKLSQKIDEIAPSEICSGGASGADLLAKKYAKSNRIKFKEFLPLFKTDKNIPYHPRYFFNRNKALVDYCHILLAFWDGKSKGTKFTIDYAKKIGRDVIIIPA